MFFFVDPLMPNPKHIEDPPCIPPEKYNDYKEHRFDCFNPPDADKQYDTYQRQVRFNCSCPPESCEHAGQK